jgi:hypothetical protein
MLNRILKATKNSTDETHERLAFGSIFLASILLYFLAITSVVPFDYFLNHNPSWIFINSLLTAIALVMFLKVFRNKKAENKTSIIGTILALFFSVFSTGCYVCGTVLFPAIGLGSSFATMPLGGIEVKIITAAMLIYSVNLLSNNVLGICKVFSNKKFSFKTSGLVLFSISPKFIYQAKHLVIVLIFILSIFLLPLLTPDSVKRTPESFICSYTK